MSDGWNPVTKRLREDLNRLEAELRQLIFIPKMRAEILAFLRNNPDSTESATQKALTQDTHILWISFYYAWRQLLKEKLIVWTSHGQGRPRTWRLSE